MTIKQAISILNRHNKWRRGGNGKMLQPKDITKAIDVAIIALEMYEDMHPGYMDRVKINPNAKQ